MMNQKAQCPSQLLPKDSYYDSAWFDRERHELFNQSWFYACTEAMIPNPGDYQTCNVLGHSLFVVRDSGGNLRAFHNLCRHRGCEVLEGAGNTGRSIRCPYHRWTYGLEGDLRTVANERECFEALPRDGLGLLPASIGAFRGLVFVNPSPSPKDDFAAWTANLDDHGWPHRFDDGTLEYVGETVFEMHCNWKVFYENAIDGYHLGYLHDQTLGRLYPSRNLWELVGRNHVWYSTEREGPPQATPMLIAENFKGADVPVIEGQTEEALYPGVVMLFPLTTLAPNPYGFSVSTLEPVHSELTNLRAHTWLPPRSTRRRNRASNGGEPKDRKRSNYILGSQEPVRLSDMESHPLESGNFHFEDMWIVEKLQRNLHSPRFKVGAMARGPGAETPLVEFQRQVLDFVPLSG